MEIWNRTDGSAFSNLPIINGTAVCPGGVVKGRGKNLGNDFIAKHNSHCPL